MLPSEGEEMAKTLATLYDHGNDISETDALKICSDHLKGSWLGLATNDFELSVIQ